MQKLLIGCTALMMLGLSSIALGHDEASWIQHDPTYKNRNGVHCCDPSHCGRVPKGMVVQRGNEWHVVGTGRVFKQGDPDLYRSAVDFDLWWCVWGGQVQCLFEPPGGM